MNTPRPSRGGGGGIASSSFICYLYWYSYRVHFVCDSASEFGAMGSTSFSGFSCPNLPLVFLNLLFLGTCLKIFLASVGTFSGSFFIFILFFCTLFWVSSLCRREFVSLP